MKLTDKMASCSVTLEQNHPRSPCIQITRVSNKPSSPLHHICERPHLVPPDDSKREAIETMVCQKTESDQLLDTIPEETTEPSPAKDGNDNQTLRTSDAVICTKTESDHLLEPLPEGIADKWKPLFDKFDVDGNGVISMEAFQVILYKYGLREDLDPHKREVLETTIEENTGGVISYQEFVNIMSDKRSLSFSIAVRSRYEECESDCIDGSNVGFKKDEYRNLTYQQRFLKMVADEILTNETDRNYFRCNFSWCLPPILIFLVSWIEVINVPINKEF